MASESGTSSSTMAAGAGNASVASAGGGGSEAGFPPRFSYPKARVGDDKDEWHGKTIPDPYRWLHDPDSDESKEWIAAEQGCFNSFIEGCHDRDLLRKRFDEVYNYEKVGSPFRRGDAWFYYRNDGLQNQSVLYKMASPEEMDSAEPFIDLNAEFPDGTTAMRSTSCSEDGRYYAYGLSQGGSDWTTIKVRDVETGKDLPDVVPWVKFSGISWTHDNKGFFYSRYPTPKGVHIDLHGGAEGDGSSDAPKKTAGTEVDANKNHMVYYHILGTDASLDRKVFDCPENPLFNVGAEVTDDGKTVLLSMVNGCDPFNKVYYLDLDDDFQAWLAADPSTAAPLRIVKLIDNFDGKYDYITNNGRKMFFVTNLKADRYRVVSVTFPESGSPTESDPAALAAIPAVEELPERTDGAVLEWVSAIAGDKVIVCYLKDVVAEMELRSLEDMRAPGTPIELPAPGTVYGTTARREQNVCFFKFTSFLHPGTVCKYDVTDPSNPSCSVFRLTRVPGFDPADFETRQVFTTSKDGTRVPLFYVRSKPLEGSTPAPSPCLLYVYGGFNISLNPSFSALRLVWLKEMNGVYAQACVRGGGEYGEEWHQAGALSRKQNCLDDFIATAEYLISTGITTSEQLAIMGGSNGGLVVLACALQRPSLYKCVISQVPVTDCLHFHQFTIGHAWCSEYGNAEESAEDFEVLYKYSPLHNVVAPSCKEESLPAILVLTADHDDRVVPHHSFKMAATLQAVAGSSPHQVNPLLIRIESKAGHGAGKPTSKILDEAADTYAFFAKCTGAHYVG